MITVTQLVRASDGITTCRRPLFEVGIIRMERDKWNISPLTMDADSDACPLESTYGGGLLYKGVWKSLNLSYNY